MDASRTMDNPMMKATIGFAWWAGTSSTIGVVVEVASTFVTVVVSVSDILLMIQEVLLKVGAYERT